MINRNILLLFIVVIVILGSGAILYKTKSNRASVELSTTTKIDTAIKILTDIPEIKVVQDAVIKSGRKPFFVREGEQNDIVVISLKESFPEDQHTTRIDTFHINVVTKEITVEGILPDKNLSLEEWKLSVRQKYFN